MGAYERSEISLTGMIKAKRVEANIQSNTFARLNLL